MNRWLKIALAVLAILLVVAFAGIMVYTRQEALDFVHNTPEEVTLRYQEELEAGLKQSPADYGLPYEEVTITNPSGMKLNGWYIAPQNGAVVMLQHGYAEVRYLMLEEAEMLHRHGYGALLTTVRAHDGSDGDLVSFGCGDREMEDLDAWYDYLLTREEVDPERIGILGQSMGGTLVIQYASQNEGIAATVAHSPPASVPDTLVTTVAWRTGLSPSLAPLIAEPMLFWAKQELDCDLKTVSARSWIGDISPRAVLVMQAALDDAVSLDSGEILVEAAGEPAELWTCPDTGHHECDTRWPAEFEERIIAFYDRYLLGQ